MITFPPELVAPAPGRQPVTAQATRVGDMVQLRVIGLSGQRIAVNYTLTCRSRRNSAVQSGSAMLAPNTPVTLLTLSQSAAPDWTGRLDVTLNDGTSYQVAIPLPTTR